VYRLRAGAITLLHPSRGYYSTDTAETNGRVVLGSTNSVEPYAGAEWIDEKAWRPPFFDFAPYVSLDARLKSVYDYHKTDARTAEDRELTINLMVGLKRPEKFYLERGVPNVFLELYHGVNPHGQFREQRHWTMIGFGLHVPM
jgi:hypothetical protein